MKDSILVFGGGPLQLSLINRSKMMGYRTIVLDPDANAPGSKISDLFFQVAGDDYNKTLEIAIDNNIKGIVTSSTDNPILIMCRIAEELNLPFPSFESCEIVLNKSKFKKFLIRNNIPHAKGNEFNGSINSNMSFSFPVIIKPIMNSGSRGVIKCDKVEDLQLAINETLKYCINKKYLIEEFIQGDEISVEALVQKNKVHILQITDKIITPPPYNVELIHIQPSKYEYLKPDIEQLLQTIVDKTGLNNCALHPELKISGNNITIIEIGPRLGGDFITSHLVPLSTGINMEEQLIKIALGFDVDYKSFRKSALISYLNFPVGKKVIKKILNQEIKANFPNIKEFCFELNVGEITRQITNSLNRYGHFVISGNNSKTLLEQRDKIIRFLENQILNIKK